VSKFLWDVFPLIHYVQFPWRFLLFAAFASSALAGVVFAYLEQTHPRWRFFGLGALIAIVLLVYGPYVHARFVAADTTTRETRTLEKDELVKATSDPELIPIEEFLTIENMRRIGMRATILDDFLPIWVATKPTALPPENHEVSVGTVEVTPIRERAVERTYRLYSPTGGRVEFFTFWFPGWTGELDGKEIDLFPRGPSGCLHVEVPPGEHTLRIRFGNSPIRTAAEIISLISLACGVVFAVSGHPRLGRPG
jgi:hypothetical protein